MQSNAFGAIRRSLHSHLFMLSHQNTQIWLYHHIGSSGSGSLAAEMMSPYGPDQQRPLPHKTEILR
jgi:hypothetical protein